MGNIGDLLKKLPDLTSPKYKDMMGWSKALMDIYLGNTKVIAEKIEYTKGLDKIKFYQPLCLNIWTDKCIKKTNKGTGKPTACMFCDGHQKYQPPTESLFALHLSGRIFLSAYTISDDRESARCFVIDFDNHSSNVKSNQCFKDALNVYSKFREYGIKSFIELSQSGAGYHLIIPFTENIGLSKGHKVLFTLLKMAEDGTKDKSLVTYDRMFPLQDKLVDGQLGNCISLPFHKSYRVNKKCCFIDPLNQNVLDDLDYLHFMVENRNKPEAVYNLLDEFHLTDKDVEVKMNSGYSYNSNKKVWKIGEMDERDDDYGEQKGIEFMSCCEFIKFYKKNEADVAQSYRFSMMTNLLPFKGGKEMIHDLCKNHYHKTADGFSKYSPEKTDMEIANIWNKKYKPTTCDKIFETGASGGRAQFNECPARNENRCPLRSPAGLGSKLSEDEPKGETYDDLNALQTHCLEKMDTPKVAEKAIDKINDEGSEEKKEAEKKKTILENLREMLGNLPQLKKGQMPDDEVVTGILPEIMDTISRLPDIIQNAWIDSINQKIPSFNKRDIRNDIKSLQAKNKKKIKPISLMNQNEIKSVIEKAQIDNSLTKVEKVKQIGKIVIEHLKTIGAKFRCDAELGNAILKISQQNIFFVDINDNVFCAWINNYFGLNAKLEVTAAVVQEICDYCVGEGKKILVRAHSHSEKGDDAYILLNPSKDNDCSLLVKVSSGVIEWVENAEEVWLMKNDIPIERNFILDTEVNVSEALLCLKELFLDHLAISNLDKFMYACIMVVNPLIHLIQNKPIIMHIGSSSAGKTSGATFMNLILTGFKGACENTTAALWRNGTNNTILVIDEVTQSETRTTVKNFLRQGSSGNYRSKSDVSSSTKLEFQKQNAQIVITSIEGFEEPDIINRGVEIVFDDKFKNKGVFNHAKVENDLVEKRNHIFNGILSIASNCLMPKMYQQEEVDPRLRYIMDIIQNHSKNRNNAFYVLMALGGDALLEKCPVYYEYLTEFQIEQGKKIKEGIGIYAVTEWLRGQQSLGSLNVIESSHEATFLDKLSVIIRNLHIEKRKQMMFSNIDMPIEQIFEMEYPGLRLEIDKGSRKFLAEKEEKHMGLIQEEPVTDDDIFIVVGSSEAIYECYCKMMGYKKQVNNKRALSKRITSMMSDLGRAGWYFREVRKYGGRYREIRKVPRALIEMDYVNEFGELKF